MKYPPRASEGKAREEIDPRDLPVFASLDAPVAAPTLEPAPDTRPPMAPRQETAPPGRPPESTDFQSLRAIMPEERPLLQQRSFNDYVIAALTPVLIWVMVTAFLNFLLDMRFVFTEVHSMNIRFVANIFILGVTALNRLVARDGRDESILYFLGLMGAAGLYTMGLQAYGAGSLGGTFMDGPFALLFNSVVIGFIWWMTNRLVHECCIDTHPEAGDIGILTGTLRKAQNAFATKEPDRMRLPGDLEPIQAIDPTEWRKPERRSTPTVLDASSRLSQRHPGISIFMFALPVLVIFAIGHRITINGGPDFEMRGHIWAALYTAASLLLLMLTSLAQLREYFRARGTLLPPGLAIFWTSLGTVMTALVLVGAFSLPLPARPSPFYVAEHQYDEWNPGSTFYLHGPDSPPPDIGGQMAFLDTFGKGVLALLALFIAYGVLRGAAAAAAGIARERLRYPPWVVRICRWVDHLLSALTQIPVFQRSAVQIWRVSPNCATCASYRNPLAAEKRMSTPDLIAYSYDALCALARDLGAPRNLGQTPYEFLEHFPPQLTTLQEEAVELTHLVVQANYAGVQFNDNVHDRLRKFWVTYDRVRQRFIR